MEGNHVIVSRRQFTGLSAAFVSAALLSGPFLTPAAAEPVDIDKLMKAGPLGDKVLGSEDAPVTIVEYASITCGHCANFHANTFPALKAKYIDTGKVRFIFREFPLDPPNGPPLASAGFMVARCAPGDRYFEMVDILFDKLDYWASSGDIAAALFSLAKQVGFTQDSFKACLTNQQVLDGLNWTKERAYKEFGVNSTPTFFINGEITRGAMRIEEMEKLIDPLL